MLLYLRRKNEGNPFSTRIWVVGSYTDTLLTAYGKNIEDLEDLEKN